MLTQLRHGFPPTCNFSRKIEPPYIVINHTTGFAIETRPIFVLRLPTTGGRQLKIELFGKRDHTRVMRIDKFSATFSHQPARKTAEAIHTSTHTLARFEHGDIPPGALQIIRSHKSRQPRTDDGDCTIII
jgi:hypothetical protein